MNAAQRHNEDYFRRGIFPNSSVSSLPSPVQSGSVGSSQVWVYDSLCTSLWKQLTEGFESSPKGIKSLIQELNPENSSEFG